MGALNNCFFLPLHSLTNTDGYPKITAYHTVAEEHPESPFT